MSGGTQLREFGDEIDSDIGVAAETDFRDAAHHSPGDHVSDHVDATSQQLTGHVRVVRRQIVRLRVRGIEKRPGLEEELDDARICRHRTGAHCLQVIEFRVVPEDTRCQRLDECLLEVARPSGFAQAECRENGEVERGIAPRAPEEFVRDEIGFADSERQCQHHAFAHAPQRFFHDLSDVIKHLRHDATLACSIQRVNAYEPD